MEAIFLTDVSITWSLSINFILNIYSLHQGQLRKELN